MSGDKSRDKPINTEVVLVQNNNNYHPLANNIHFV